MHAEQWRHISIEGIDMYTPQNVPIEALDMWNGKFVFGWAVEVLGIDKKVLASVESKQIGGQRTVRRVVVLGINLIQY